MRSYLGIDAHSNSGLEFAAVGQDGELLWRDRCPLDGKLIQETARRAPRPCSAVFEQGELATWLHMTLQGVCDTVVVADPRHNRLIATSADKNDAFDAFTLADLGRGGYLRPVYQPSTPFLELRRRVRHHHRLTQHLTAVKNQIKATYRAHGVPTAGSRVYSPDYRSQWLLSLPSSARSLTEDLYAVLDVVDDRASSAVNALARSVRRFPPAKRMLRVPQVGIVTAATFTAFVVTPQRFRSRQRLWSYCGFGLTRRSSGLRFEPTRLRRSFNRHLKRSIKGSVQRLIHRNNTPFATAYFDRVHRGMVPSRARLTLSRKLINVLRALWIHEVDYDPDRLISL